MDGQVVGYIWEEGKSGAKTILIAIPGCRDSRGRHPQVGDRVQVLGIDEEPEEPAAVCVGDDEDALRCDAPSRVEVDTMPERDIPPRSHRNMSQFGGLGVDAQPQDDLVDALRRRAEAMEKERDALRWTLDRLGYEQDAVSSVWSLRRGQRAKSTDEESDEEWLRGIFARHPEVKEDLTAALRNALSKKHPDLMAAIDAKDWDRVRELARPLKLEEEKCQPDEAGAQLRKILIEENCRDEHGQEVEARLVYVLSAIRKLADPPPVADPDPAKTTEPRWGWRIEGVTIPPCAESSDSDE